MKHPDSHASIPSTPRTAKILIVHVDGAAGPSTSRALRFLDDLLAGFLAAAVIAVLGYLAFATAGCAAQMGGTADPFAEDKPDVHVGLDLGETSWPRADAGRPDSAPFVDAAPADTATPWTDTAAASDTTPPPAPDTAPMPDTAPRIDTAPTPDTAPPAPDAADATTACPSHVYCTFATGAQGRVGAPCFESVDCCSGYCFDPVPGDGVKGSCYADPDATGWCGTAAAPEWCPGTPDKVCKAS